MTEADLHSAFKDFAAAISLLVLKQKRRPYAVVNFTSSEAAQSALRALNGALVNGSHIYVSNFKGKYQKSPDFNVFVKNFPRSVTSQDLEVEFAPCGPVVCTEVAHGRAGNSLRHGCIQFENAEAAAKAIAKDGQEWLGEELKVEPFVPLGERGNLHSKGNLYVSGFKADITKTDLDALFSTFGEIKSSVIQHASDRVEGKCFGFVEFMEESSAEAALKALNGYEGLGCVLEVTPYMSKPVRKKLLQSQYKQKQAEWKKTNLVFSQLPLSTTEDKLREICRNYGQITSVKVQSKAVRVIGYVNFETEESADSAQKALNRSRIEEQIVFVSHWKPREELIRYLRSIQARKQHSKA